MTKSLLILMDVTDNLIDKFGEHIEILNNKYDIHWKIIKLPELLPCYGEVLSTEFRKGWNYYRSAIIKGIEQFELDLAFKEIENIFNYVEK